jgi:hypothetical protein
MSLIELRRRNQVRRAVAQFRPRPPQTRLHALYEGLGYFLPTGRLGDFFVRFQRLHEPIPFLEQAIQRCPVRFHSFIECVALSH